MSYSISALPLVEREGVSNGCEYECAQKCFGCSEKLCLESVGTVSVPEVCPMGVSYIPTGRGFVFGGFYIADWRPEFPASDFLKKLYVRNRRSDISASIESKKLDWLVKRVSAAVSTKASSRILKGMEDISEERVLEARSLAEDAFAAQAKRSMAGYSDQVTHDLLQLVSAIKQNSEFVLTARYGSKEKALGRRFARAIPLERRLAERVWRREQSIFHLAELADVRLSMARQALSMDDYRGENIKLVQVYSAFQKVLRPFEELCEQRGIRLQRTGESFGAVQADFDSFHILPLALVDNALKYAPPGTRIEVVFGETRDEVTVAVSSFGPKLDVDEYEAVFEPGVRGRHVGETIEGAGVGLWHAAKVVEMVGGSISIEQDRSISFEKSQRFRTSLKVRLTRSWG